uniref:Androgen-induced gene 1 protein n=1 Tax=Oryzias sinensis TaxID=183150 RepID=A0A8C7WWR0_9TELE
MSQDPPRETRSTLQAATHPAHGWSREEQSRGPPPPPRRGEPRGKKGAHKGCCKYGPTRFGHSWKFGGVIQATFFGLCVLIDVSSLLTNGGDSREQERQHRKLIGLRDWIMAVLAFPVGAFVVFTFWTLYLYDRELVYPKLLDNFIPQWLNHGMVSYSLCTNQSMRPRKKFSTGCTYVQLLKNSNGSFFLFVF